MIYKIKDIVSINPESIGKNYMHNSIKYLDTANITNGEINEIISYNLSEAPSRAKRVVKHNDIIYSTVRPNLCHYGIIENPDENLVVSTGFAVLRCGELIDPFYLYSYLTLPSITNKLHLIAENSTSTYPSIKPSDIGDIEICLPSIEEQKKITKIMKSLKDKMALNTIINNNLYELLNKTFKHWFETYERFNDSDFEETEIGKIPSEFKIIELKDLIDISGGFAYKASKLSENIDDSILISMGNVELYNLFNFNNLKYYDDVVDEKYMAGCGDLFICTRDVTQQRNQLGCPGIIPKIFKNKKIIIGTNLYRIHYKEFDKSLNRYLFLLLNSSRYRERIVGSAKGTAVLMISKDDILKFKFGFPQSISIITEFNKIINPLFEKIENNICENETLKQLRDTLLPKLMNGEIDLDNIEI